MENTYELNTEVASFAVWDPVHFEDIKEYIFRIYNTLTDFINEGKIVNFGTGADGRYNISLRINKAEPLTSEEKELLQAKEENLKLVVNSGSLVVGSPEVIGVDEKESIENGYVKKIDGIENGVYKVDLYFVYDHEFEERLNEAYEKDPENYKSVDLGKDRSCYVFALTKVDENHEFKKLTSEPNFG